MKKLILLFSITLLLFSCSSNGDEDNSNNPNNNPPTSNNVPDGMIGSTATIGPSGGEVAIPSANGNISLTIPQGALNSDTEITMFTPDDSSIDAIYLGFEPDGLEFSAPVSVNISLTQNLFTTHALSSMWNISELNDMQDVGSEQHRWKRLENIEISPSGNSMSGEMNHFSTGLVLLGIQRPAYLVIDIPGKYLRPGDGLIVMSGNSSFEYNWVPGHVGIVNSVDPHDGTRDGNLEVIESTLDGGPNDNLDGVQKNPFLRFKRTSQHLYMGARRPTATEAEYTDIQRQATVEFARDKLGLGYDVLGQIPIVGDLGGILPNRWSCSELAEASWDVSGRGLFGLLDFFPSPVEMFEKTKYVSEITVKVGEEVKIPIYPVVIDKTTYLSTSQGFYNVGVQQTGANLSLTGTIPNNTDWSIDNTHVYKAKTFTWTPIASDAGTTVRVNFKMDGAITLLASGHTEHYSIEKYLDIYVRGAHTTIEILPIPQGTIGLTYNNHLSVPDNAVVGEPSNDHLIDLDTGEYPTNPVFTNQIFDSFTEGYLQNYYGCRIHLSRLDATNSPTPHGSHLWSYSFDYYIPKYNGL